MKEIELDEGDSERVRDDYECVREEIHILRALDHQYVVKYEKEISRTKDNQHFVSSLDFSVFHWKMHGWSRFSW